MPAKPKQNTAIAVTKDIDNKIYFIRDQRVMLDGDLAEIYQVETRRLKEQVRRNRHRFPADFMFELTSDELKHLQSLRSQNATLNDSGPKRGQHSKYLPFVFTEHGAVMLASVFEQPNGR